MAIYDNERIMIKACKMFYEDNLSQKEIASILGISKPQICRMINYAKSNGVVQVSIKNPYEQEFQLEEKLKNIYHLKEAFVFQIDNQNPSEEINQLGELASNQLDRYFTDHSIIGIMSGRTIDVISQYARRLTREGLEFVPLVGNLGSIGSDWHANTIAMNFAQKTGGCYHLLNAPILYKNRTICKMVKSEPSISQVLQKGENCKLALVGIGNISQQSTTYLSGACTKEDMDELLLKGAVASVGTSYVNSKGELVKTSLCDRSIGLSLEACGNKTLIAFVCGKEKLTATKAALKSGYINILMTTSSLAEQLCNE
jgi:Transcriptional regulator, contains sigma factor-related N-terminal domain